MSEDRSNPRNLGPTQENAGANRGDSNLEPDPPPKSISLTGSAHRKDRGSYPNLFVPGTMVGRYRLLAPLASGGMAQVWAAKPEGPGFARTVALKLIRQEYAADEEYARMFVDEATVAASVRHPNVCETYELCREDGVLFMAIEWVAGDSLAGILHRDQGLEPLPYYLATRIIADAAAGLHAAHEAVDPDGALLGVVHRDVSPPNILLGLHGEVKVSDFGIAKAKYQLHSRTRTGEIKGKFAYIAPEQIGGKNIDRRADIFALGCVLYVATVGLRPFGSGPRAMSKILAGEYKRPASLIEQYPTELERIIARCLQKSPADRYPNADELRTDLERMLLGASAPVGTRDIATLVSQRLDAAKRRVVETLTRSNQFLPDAMVYQLVRGEVDQTPTATSSVMFGPASITALEVAPPATSPTSDAHRAPQKPMVRFTALGRMLTPDLPADSPSGERHSRDSEAAEPDNERTTSEGAIPGLLPGSGPPEGIRSDRASHADSVGPTFRPPQMQPLLGTASAEKPGEKSARWSDLRLQLWTATGLLLAAVLGWASCQLLPP